MPPKAKFTKEEIINAAFDIVRKNGLLSLTARTLGAKLGSSARPIFTVFTGMEEVIAEVKACARKEYNKYINVAFEQADDKPFKMVGYMFIKFAQDEPYLFRMLFMSDEFASMDSNSVLPLIDSNYERIFTLVRDYYHTSIENARILFEHLWIYSHGIASLCATKSCSFTDDEIKNMLSFVAQGLFMKLGIKVGN